MKFVWNEYSSDSGVPSTPLLLSERSQSIILAALDWMQKRYAWHDVSDSEWDDIDGSVAHALHEVMEISMADYSPVGMVSWFPLLEDDIPEKWLICDGSAVSRDDYFDLYIRIRSIFGSSGSMFNLPDLRERFLFGAAIDANVGDVAGDSTHVLTTAEMPAHTHIQQGRNTTGGSVFHSQVNAVSTAAAPVATTTVTGSTGGGAAHNNMPPYMRGYWCIKALP